MKPPSVWDDRLNLVPFTLPWVACGLFIAGVISAAIYFGFIGAVIAFSWGRTVESRRSCERARLQAVDQVEWNIRAVHHCLDDEEFADEFRDQAQADLDRLHEMLATLDSQAPWRERRRRARADQ
jgi:hypothetical protein